MLTEDRQAQLRMAIAREQILALTLTPDHEGFSFWWVEYDRAHAQLLAAWLKGRRRGR